MIAMTFQDFNPLTSWEKDIDLKTLNKTQTISNKKHSNQDINQIKIRDLQTGKTYPLIDNDKLRHNASNLLLIHTPIYQTLLAIFNIIARVYRILTLYYFRTENPSPLLETAKDLANILFTPVGLVAMEVTALFAMIVPKNGLKVYNSLSELTFNKIFEPSEEIIFSPLNENARQGKLD